MSDRDPDAMVSKNWIQSGASRPVEMASILLFGLLVAKLVSGFLLAGTAYESIRCPDWARRGDKATLLIKFPWRLPIGDHVWLGERVWIDYLATVSVYDHISPLKGA